MSSLLVTEAWSKEITNEPLDAFVTTGTTDYVVQKTEEFSEIAMPILQTTGLDINDVNDVLEAGFYGI